MIVQSVKIVQSFDKIHSLSSILLSLFIFFQKLLFLIHSNSSLSLSLFPSSLNL